MGGRVNAPDAARARVAPAEQGSRRLCRRVTWTATATAGAIALLFYSSLLVFGTYYGVDLNYVGLASMCEAHNLIEAGGPMWLSPHIGNGLPFLGSPESGLFYPPFWISLLFPLDLGLSIYPILHLVLAAVSMTWLARTFGLRPATAAGCGLVFVFSGTVVDLIVHWFYIGGATWIPLSWAAVRRHLHPRGDRGDLLLLVVGLAMLSLGADIQGFCVAAGLVGIEVARALWSVHRRSGSWPRAATASLGIAVGFLLSAPLWAAFWGEAALTLRSGALLAADMYRWSFDSTMWPAALWTGPVFSDELPHVSLWRLLAVGGDDGMVWNRSPYLGPLFIGLLVVGAGLRRAWLPAGVALFALLLSLGDTVPFLENLSRVLPPLRLFRYPAKYLLLMNVAATVVVGLAFARQARQRSFRRRCTWATVAALLSSLVLLGLVLAGSERLDLLDPELLSQPHLRGMQPFSEQLFRAGLMATAPLAVAVLVLLVRPGLSRYLLLLLVWDLMLSALTGVMVSAPLADLHSPFPSMIKQKQPPPVFCVAFSRELHPPEVEEDWNRSWFLMAVYRTYLVPQMHACDRVVNASSYGSLQPTANQRLSALMARRYSSAARALGCTHFLTDRPPEDGGVEALALDGYHPVLVKLLESGPRLYRIVSPVPETFVVQDPVLITTDHQFQASVLQSGSAEQVVAIIDDPLGRLGPGDTLPVGGGAGETTLRWEHRARATVEVGGEGGALVGLRTEFHAGWRAEQAGIALPVARSSGQHVVALVPDLTAGPILFSYKPPFWSLGLGGMGVGAVALIAVMLWPGHGARRREHHPGSG